MCSRFADARVRWLSVCAFANRVERGGGKGNACAVCYTDGMDDLNNTTYGPDAFDDAFDDAAPADAGGVERLTGDACLEAGTSRDEDLLELGGRVVVRVAGDGLVVGNRCQAGRLDVDGDAAALLGE